MIEIMKFPFSSKQGLPNKSIRPPPSLSAVARRTIVSPLVKQVAQRYFFRDFEVIGPKYPDLHPDPGPPRSHLPEKKLRYEQKPDSRTTIEYYDVLHTQDGKCFEVRFHVAIRRFLKIIQVGDCVAVHIGRQDGVLQIAGSKFSSENEFATRYW